MASTFLTGWNVQEFKIVQRLKISKAHSHQENGKVLEEVRRSGEGKPGTQAHGEGAVRRRERSALCTWGLWPRQDSPIGTGWPQAPWPPQQGGRAAAMPCSPSQGVENVSEADFGLRIPTPPEALPETTRPTRTPPPTPQPCRSWGRKVALPAFPTFPNEVTRTLNPVLVSTCSQRTQSNNGMLFRCWFLDDVTEYGRRELHELVPPPRKPVSW